MLAAGSITGVSKLPPPPRASPPVTRASRLGGGGGGVGTSSADAPTPIVAPRHACPFMTTSAPDVAAPAGGAGGPDASADAPADASASARPSASPPPRPPPRDRRLTGAAGRPRWKALAA